ncbi:MAG TPA: thioesterase family protein [Woeseiaceae bacterium]|nr:thioesterase family protein [Woeseiaceae bacterium]
MSGPAKEGFAIHEGLVRPEWIDINGHMNVAYYVLAFDKAVDDLLARVGVTDDYIRETGGTTFAVECHVTYRQELTEAQPYRIESQVLAYDQKRVHQFQRMYHAEENYLAATAEWMNLHVDLETRRVSAWPEFVLRALEELTAAQPKGDLPEEAGKRMRIAKPLYSLDKGSAGG